MVWAELKELEKTRKTPREQQQGAATTAKPRETRGGNERKQARNAAVGRGLPDSSSAFDRGMQFLPNVDPVLRNLGQ